MICAADLYEQIIWADGRTGLFIPARFLYRNGTHVPVTQRSNVKVHLFISFPTRQPHTLQVSVLRPVLQLDPANTLLHLASLVGMGFWCDLENSVGGVIDNLH
jgi:hypothetical protein